MPTDARRVQAVFPAAAEIADPADRAKFLDGACDGDAALRARVEALLRAHDQADSLLDHPAVAPPDPDHGATQALTGVPGPGVAAGQTAGGDNGASDDEALTFLAPPTRPDSLGRLGHYEVLQVLGRGGFGIVFRAFDEVLHRVVAVKVLSPQMAATSPARKRFLREARSSAQVRHENVVQVYEVGEQPMPHIAMEFIPGETLQQRLDRVGPVGPAEVVRVGRQIAEGLAAAHATDLIHRDIKPANVLLEGGAQRVKITDFGLARAADDASISQSGVIAGTPMYMAPEQAKGDKLDRRADLFSLGSVLYQMASGRPPRANGTVAVLKRVAEDTPRDIREIIPEAPQWLCAIIAKLHAKDPGDRYQSAREVADVLADCEAQLKANSRLKDYSRIPRGKPRRPGRRGWVAAAAVLLPALALAVTEIAGVTHLFRGQQETPHPTNLDGGLTRDQLAEQGPPPPAVAPFDAAKAKGHQEAWARHLGVPVEYTNGIGMRFVIIPPGEFTMGSPDGEVGRNQDEGPQHRVLVTKPFWVGERDVTVEQFRAFVKATAYRTEAERGAGAHRLYPGGNWQHDPEANWLNPGFSQADDHPVVCVSWDDANSFCAWLSRLEGVRYVLPTEAQWEYVCRAGSGTRFYFGDDGRKLGDFAWYAANSDGQTHPVARKLPNAWGLYDMHGNVWQWTADWYGANYYLDSKPEDPAGPPAGAFRVLRGGDWNGPENCCSSAHRVGWGAPAHPGATFWVPHCHRWRPEGKDPAAYRPFAHADA